MKNIFKIILSAVIALIMFVSATGYAYAWNWEDDMLAKDRQTLRDWESVLELECFLVLDDAPIVLVAGKDGKVSFSGQCEDFAFQLRDRAREWGRLLDVEILTPQEFVKYYHKKGTYHAINKAVIGNEWWYVDKKADKLWHVLNLD